MSHCAFLCSLLHVLKIDVDKLEEQVKEKEKKKQLEKNLSEEEGIYQTYKDPSLHIMLQHIGPYVFPLT